MKREDIMTLVERYALAMRLVDRHGNQYGDRDLLTLTHLQIREGLKALVASEREACAKVCEILGAEDDSFYAEFSRAKDCAAAIRARGEKCVAITTCTRKIRAVRKDCSMTYPLLTLTETKHGQHSSSAKMLKR